MKARERLFFILILLIAFYTAVPLFSAEGESQGEFRAFLVGINEYEQPRQGESHVETFRSLNCCKNDVTAMEKELVRNGYKLENIEIVTDVKTERLTYHPTKSEIERRLDEIIDKCGKEDVLFVFFACHGIRLEGVNYLVPYDGRYVSNEQSVEERAGRIETLIDVRKIYEKLKPKNCAAKTKILITDACQARVLKNDDRSPSQSKGSEFGMNPQDIPAGLIQITSCSPGEKSYEGEEYGIFSSILLEGLKDQADTDGDGRTSITELFHYVSERVPEEARKRNSQYRQKPLMNLDDVGGDIVFSVNIPKVKSNELKASAKEKLEALGKESKEEEREKLLTEAENLLNEAEQEYPEGEYKYLRGQIKESRQTLESMKREQAQELAGEALTQYEGGKYEKALELIDKSLMLYEIKMNRKLKGTIERKLGIGRAAGEKKTLRIKGIDYTFCWCQAGSFTMGSPETEKGRESDETPHEVRLSRGFWMLESEVTQEMWESVMGTTIEEQRDKANKEWKLYGAGREYPMYYVSWEDCQDFISKLNGEDSELQIRLPSEAEWEYACRAGSTGEYGGTGDLDEMGWYGDKSGYKTHEVKTKRANAWGLYDMHGNVYEWCQDLYDAEYYKNSPPTAPTGPESGSSRVFRGGGWDNSARGCRSAIRFRDDPGGRFISLGFRLAASSAR